MPEQRPPIGGTVTKISAAVPDELGVALEERARAQDRCNQLETPSPTHCPDCKSCVRQARKWPR